MLLTELTGVKKFQKYSEYDLKKILRRFGITTIAYGSYGEILTHKDWDYVVKLYSKDPYYTSFVNFARKHPNPHYPKFGRAPLQLHAFHTRHTSDEDRMWLLKIEKLQELTKEEGESLMYGMRSATSCVYYLDNESSKPAFKEHLDEPMPHFTYHNLDGTTTKGGTMREWAEKNPQIISLARAYNAIWDSEEVKGSEDQHAKNFMKRADGTLVIIDPVWEGSNPQKEYDAWLASERDTGGDDDYEYGMVSGPKYDYQYRKEKEAREQAEKDRRANKWQPVRSDIDDDIPF